MATPAAVGTDVTANDNSVTAGESTLDVSVTIHADADILVVAIGTQTSGRTPSSVTIDFTGNPALTKLVESQYTDSGNQNYASLWYITTDNANWATGAHTVTITPSGYNCTITAICRQYNNVDPTTPFSASSSNNWGGTTSTGAETSLNSATDETIVSAGAWYNVDYTTGTGQTGTDIDYQDNGSSAQSFACQDETGTAGSNDVGFTLNSSTQWAVVAGSLQDVDPGTTIDGSTTTLSVTPNQGNVSLDVTVAGVLASMEMASFQGAVSSGSNISGNVTTLEVAANQGTVSAANNIDGALATLEITANQGDASLATGFIADTFDGTGALGSHWSTYQSSVQTVDRQSGYMEADVSDNTGDKTLWYEGDRGRADYQLVTIPSGAIPNEYVFHNVGIGPTSNPRDDHTYVHTALNFAGLMVHDDDFSSANYMFAVIGHRSTVAESTIEIKSTSGGSSSVDDEGDNVFGTGVTHGDLAVESHSNGDFLFKFRNVGTSDWTYINGGTGYTPGTRPNLGSAGDQVAICFIAYADGTVGVPFVGSVDSVSAYEQEANLAQMTVTSYQGDLTASSTIYGATSTLIDTTFPGTVSAAQTIDGSLTTTELSSYQGAVSLANEIGGSLTDLEMTAFQGDITGTTLQVTPYRTYVVSAKNKSHKVSFKSKRYVVH